MKSPKQGLILITAVLFMTANMYAKKEKKKKEDDTVAVKTMTDSAKCFYFHTDGAF